MHHIYHTSGVILGSVPTGESNRFYKIFTEELGLVHATAQAVREAKSKLRYSLQDFSWASLDLVRGREVWRITSAQGVEHRTRNSEQGTVDMRQRILFARVCALMSRLMHGEGKHDELFGEIVAIREFLQREKLSHTQEASFEALATLRILTHLGYFDPRGYGDFVAGTLSRELLDVFENVRTEAIPRINESLKASHL